MPYPPDVHANLPRRPMRARQGIPLTTEERIKTYDQTFRWRENPYHYDPQMPSHRMLYRLINALGPPPVLYDRLIDTTLDVDSAWAWHNLGPVFGVAAKEYHYIIADVEGRYHRPILANLHDSHRLLLVFSAEFAQKLIQDKAPGLVQNASDMTYGKYRMILPNLPRSDALMSNIPASFFGLFNVTIEQVRERQKQWMARLLDGPDHASPAPEGSAASP